VRLIPWLAIIALTLTATPGVADDCRHEVSEQTLDPAGWQALEIVNSRGDVVVRASQDGRVHLSAVKVVCGSEIRRTELSRDTHVETRRQGGTFMIEVTYPRRTDVHIGFWDLFRDFQMPRVEVRLALDVPASLPLTVRGSSADLSTEGLTGPQILRSSSGDIRVRDARSAIEATTSSGDIEADGIASGSLSSSSGDVSIDRAAGPLRIRSNSGDLTIRGAQDSIVAETSSGDVKIDRALRGLDVSTSSGGIEIGRAAGGVRLGSSSGDLSVELAAPFRGTQLTSSSGGVSVQLGRGVECLLDLESTSGTLNVSLPVELGKVTKHSIAGRVGRGTAPLRIHTSSGDIEVEGGGGGR